jgi:hypothetical protein
MNTPKSTTNRLNRTGHLEWVCAADVVVSPTGQRELREGWAAQIAAEFDPDRFLPPLVSRRDGKLYVIDGQHRFEALRILGWDTRPIQCWVYDGISEAQEADLFLWHNNRKTVSAFDKFRIGVSAERDAESDIDRIVRASGFKVANSDHGGIRAVGALRKVYAHGPAVLARTLKIIRDSYGDDGLGGEVIEGVGLVCARYNGSLDDAHAVSRLTTVRGGIGALNSKAYTARKVLAKPLAQCYAAAVVDIVNAGKGGKKLPGWWS